jgi:hypothetical protein
VTADQARLAAGIMLAFLGNEKHRSGTTRADCFPTVAGAGVAMRLIGEAAASVLQACAQAS